MPLRFGKFSDRRAWIAAQEQRKEKGGGWGTRGVPAAGGHHHRSPAAGTIGDEFNNLFGWLVADGWCWFVLREEYCWLVAGGWFVCERKILLAGG
jgi:hypothetical protein